MRCYLLREEHLELHPKRFSYRKLHSPLPQVSPILDCVKEANITSLFYVKLIVEQRLYHFSGTASRIGRQERSRVNNEKLSNYEREYGIVLHNQLRVVAPREHQRNEY
jgi:hypothetical protein